MATTYRGFGSAPQIVVGPVSVSPGTVFSGALNEISVTVPGSEPGMFFLVQAPDLEANASIVGAICTTAGTVKIRIANAQVGNISAATQNMYFLGL